MWLNPRCLESFLVAAETLSFSETAQRTGTVQSAVSTHIKRLEDSVGVSLMERGRGQSIRLTEAGETMTVYARRILDLMDEAAHSVRRPQSRKTISLGTTSTLAMSVVPNALGAFAASHPDVDVVITCGRSGETMQRFDTGDFDLALVVDQGRRAGRVFVESAELAWTAGWDFKAPDEGTIPLAFQSDGRDLRRYALNTLDRAGVTGEVTHTSADPTGVRALVKANLAVTVMPRFAVEAPFRVLTEAEGFPSIGTLPFAAYIHVGQARPELTALAELLRKDIQGGT